MYKIAILGCENSHADFFLDYIINQKAVDDIEIIGIYSDEKDAALRLQEQFNVYVAENYDEFVGKIDGLIITPGHGFWPYTSWGEGEDSDAEIVIWFGRKVQAEEVQVFIKEFLPAYGNTLDELSNNE